MRKISVKYEFCLKYCFSHDDGVAVYFASLFYVCVFLMYMDSWDAFPLFVEIDRPFNLIPNNLIIVFALFSESCFRIVSMLL